MENIYDDLCNYEDVNIVQELRDENEAQKVKIAEHTAALEKIQKEILQDYDTLDKEFKTLHRNYCSLLMTARAEIKRKTEMITQLNTEKDMMILEALKSGKMITRNFNQPGRMNYHDRTSGSRNNKEDNVKQRKNDTKHERRVSPVLPPKNAVPDSGTYNKSKPNPAGEKVELSNNRRSNVHENIAQQKTAHNEPPKISASSIKNRRKSMPAVRNPVTVFSSDDELEQNRQTQDPRTDNERRNVNKLPNDRNSYKTASGTSSMDNRRYNSPESTLRDNYKGRSSRHDSTTYRGRDKYEISLKYRKHYSPERGQKRHHKELQEDYTRYERGRYQGRSFESPESYESYNRDQRRKTDHRSDHDRYTYDYEKRPHHDSQYTFKYELKDHDEPHTKRQNTYDYEKNRPHHDSQYTFKYELKDHDEPHTKRQKTESYSNPVAHIKEGKRHYHEREPMASEPIFSPHEYDMGPFSCQSPDSIHTDAAPANPIKEIMATAATPLEDPRVTSKKYVILKENGVEKLSTVMGRTINIKQVNKAAWDVEPVEIPVGLVRPPSQCSDTLINEIYMDIDNPVTKLDQSLESGEVRATDDEVDVNHSKPKEIQHVTQEFNISKPEDPSKQATNLEKVSEPNLAKYRIPKIGQNNKNTQSKIDVPVIDVDENVSPQINVYKKGAGEDSFPKELLTNKLEYNERDERLNMNLEEFLPNNKKYSKIESNKKSKSRERSDNQNRATLSKIAIVADDLELSDDNSDHMDTNKRVESSDKLHKKCDMPLNKNEARTDDSVNYENKTLTNSLNTEIERTVDTAELKDVASEEKTKESDGTKKQKTKKKKSKSKEMSKHSKESADAIHVPEKKHKSKKEKDSKPKETKEKFSDLFGDSNSLMTPEDLGIPSYLPISEDAQDAVDMKINQIIDAEPLIDAIPSDTLTENRGESKIEESKAVDDIPKAVSQTSNDVLEDKEVDNDFKKEPFERTKEIIDPNQLPSLNVYANLNPTTDLDDDKVAKTIIISTGKQSEIMYENKTKVTKLAEDVKVNAVDNIKAVHPIPATKEFKSDTLKALATSTPHKEFSSVNPLLYADTTKTDAICDSQLSTAVATITGPEQVANQTEQNTLESNDAPDMRIFVKRRRKVFKRSPMT